LADLSFFVHGQRAKDEFFCRTLWSASWSLTKFAGSANDTNRGTPYTRADYPDYHEGLAALFAATKIKPNNAEEHEGVTSLIAALEAGRGVALVPSCVACMVGPRLKILSLNPAEPSIVVGAARCEKEVSAIVGKFIAAARPEPRKA
jgi:hypothetical protein